MTRSTDASAETPKISANVPRPFIASGLNEFVSLSCDSQGQRLSLCIWEHQGNGKRPAIYVDEGGMEGRTGWMEFSMKEMDLWRDSVG